MGELERKGHADNGKEQNQPAGKGRRGSQSPQIPPPPRTTSSMRSRGVHSDRVAPEGDPSRSPRPPIPPPRPGPLTCEHKEQNQLGKPEPCTAGQPSRVHPRRRPEVARQASRADGQAGRQADRRTGAAGWEQRRESPEREGDGRDAGDGGRSDAPSGRGVAQRPGHGPQPQRGGRGGGGTAPGALGPRSLCLSRRGPGGGRGGRSCVRGQHRGSRRWHPRGLGV